jgi:MFS family permease
VRRLLLVSQAVIGSSALVSTLLVVSGKAQLWTVVLCALWLGCGSALGLPARQVFVSELVPHGHLTSAIGLNGLAMNLARMLGPAAAGLIIARWGTAAAFAVGAGCAAAVAAALLWLRPVPVVRQRGELDDGSLRGALAYLRRRPDLVTVLACAALVSLFAAHTALITVMMATTVFGEDASRLAVLATAVAGGSITASLLAARRSRPGPGVLTLGAAALCGASVLAAAAPTFRSYTCSLFFLGLGVMTFFLTSTAMVQLATDRGVAGRVLGLLSVIQVGTLAIGAPIVGWIGTSYGARWMHACAAAASLVVALVCAITIRFRRDVVAGFNEAVDVLEGTERLVQTTQPLVSTGRATSPALPRQEGRRT